MRLLRAKPQDVRRTRRTAFAGFRNRRVGHGAWSGMFAFGFLGQQTGRSSMLWIAGTTAELPTSVNGGE
jgi:hypothetical protein